MTKVGFTAFDIMPDDRDVNGGVENEAAAPDEIPDAIREAQIIAECVESLNVTSEETGSADEEANTSENGSKDETATVKQTAKRTSKKKQAADEEVTPDDCNG